RQPVRPAEVLERASLIAAGQYRTAVADDDDATVTQHTATRQARLQGMTVTVAQLDLLPAITGIDRAEQMATQPVGKHQPALAPREHAEEGTLVGRIEPFPGLSHVRRAEQAAHLAYHQQPAMLDLCDG